MAIQKRVTIDCRGHLIGRLASKVAKELLQGQKVTAVRCEELHISGGHFRNKLKFLAFLKKKCNTNPTRGGPWHHRSPAQMFYRTVRGMLPHKTVRGTLALARLRVFEGIPPRYQRVKRLVVPDALTVTNLRPNRAFTVLGELASEVGWNQGPIVAKLEARRKVKSHSSWRKRNARLRMFHRARKIANTKLTPLAQDTLKKIGLKLEDLTSYDNLQENRDSQGNDSLKQIELKLKEIPPIESLLENRDSQGSDRQLQVTFIHKLPLSIYLKLGEIITEITTNRKLFPDRIIEIK